jgi:hypothetical protein
LLWSELDTHDLSAVVILFAKHIRDCDSEGLQGHACEYATRLMAKMPYSNSNKFYLATQLAVAQVTLY